MDFYYFTGIKSGAKVVQIGLRLYYFGGVYIPYQKTYCLALTFQ